MTFIILAVLAFHLYLIFRKYRTIFSVILSIVLMFGITSVVLFWVIAVSEVGTAIQFFGSSIGMREFYYIIAAWYAADCLCLVLIVRGHQAYNKINLNTGK
jgi:hypothetical protein